MEHLLHLAEGVLQQDEDPGDLDAAAGGSGAGPDEGEHHQQHLGELGPQIVVGGGEAGGGHDGRHLEGGVPHALPHAVVQIPDVPGDGGGGHGHHDEEEPQLVAFQGLPGLPRENQEIDGEIHREQQHKDGDDDLHRRVAEGACPFYL